MGALTVGHCVCLLGAAVEGLRYRRWQLLRQEQSGAESWRGQDDAALAANTAGHTALSSGLHLFVYGAPPTATRYACSAL
jgi:hypothetical protein